MTVCFNDFFNSLEITNREAMFYNYLFYLLFYWLIGIQDYFIFIENHQC